VAGAFPIRLQSQLPRPNLRCFQFLRNVVSRSEVHFVCCLPLEGRMWQVLVVLLNVEPGRILLAFAFVSLI